MASENIRAEVWGDMLDADRITRYYQALADRHHRNTLLVRLILAGSAMAGVVSFLAALPAYAQVTFGLVIAVAVVLDLVVDFQRKAAVLHTITVDMRHNAVEWQDLWGRIDGMNDNEARDRINALSHRMNTITARTGDIGVGEDPRLNQRCAEATYAVFTQQYGLSG